MNLTLGLKKRAIWFFFIAALLVGAVTVSAQASTPINIGENQTGEISAAQPTPSYSITVNAPQNVVVQVLAITQGLAPSFRVFDPSGIVLQSAVNDGTQSAVNATLAFLSPGTYRIEVQGAAGVTGQFVISVQGGAPIQPPTPITVGQVLNGEVNSEAPNQSYSFAGSPTEVLRLTVRSEAPSSAPTVTLVDTDLSETLGISSARLGGVQYRIPTGATNFLVSLTHSGATPATYILCLETDTVASACAGTQTAAVPTASAPTPVPTALPTLPTTGACVVAPSSAGTVNIRSGPGTNFSVATQLTANTTAAVVGRLPDNSWYQVNVNGVIGWIAGSVVRLGGQCGTVPAVTLTPSGGAPTATSSTATATATSTATATATLAAVATLNFSLPAVFGSTSLTSGFAPDPFSTGITGGGPASASYLGSGCTGFTTSAPSFSVNYTSGSFPMLRFYFIGSGDTTMIINTPGANYVCSDNSYGTLNPTLDFNTPSSGRYDVWIGTFAQSGSVGGTLYVTEIVGNHP